MTRGVSLSDEELQELGVTRTRSEYGTVYTVPCAVCGRPTHSRQFSTNRVYKCNFCKKEVAKKRDAKMKAAKEKAEKIMADEIGVDYTHLHRFEQGASKFGAAYTRNIETARKVIDRFDSVPEVIACIELLHIRARIIVHQKVGDYTVDFCLPEEKVVIEIDGSLYHSDEAKEQMRDYAICYMLGDGWDVRHVPADAVAKRPQAFGGSMKRMLNARRHELGMKELGSK